MTRKKPDKGMVDSFVEDIKAGAWLMPGETPPTPDQIGRERIRQLEQQVSYPVLTTDKTPAEIDPIEAIKMELRWLGQEIDRLAARERELRRQLFGMQVMADNQQVEAADLATDQQ